MMAAVSTLLTELRDEETYLFNMTCSAHDCYHLQPTAGCKRDDGSAACEIKPGLWVNDVEPSWLAHSALLLCADDAEGQA